MSDVVSFSTPRAYPLPKNVIEEAQQGLRWERAYKTPVKDSSRWLAKFLSAGGSVTADVVGILASVSQDFDGVSRPGEMPNEARIEFAMNGGRPLKRWLAKMQSGINVAHEQAMTAALKMMDFSEDFLYLGVKDARDQSIVRSLVRVDKVNPMGWEQWTPSKTWRKVPVDELAYYDTLELDKELAAVTAAALVEVEGVILRFEAPRALLLEQPIVAAVEVDEDLPAGAHYYAIVDATDQTAVMDVITISPGPVVKVRAGGKWEDSDAHLQKLRGISPPPLVELDGDTLEMVLAQVDGTVNAAQTDPDYVESLGHEDEIVAKEQESMPEESVAASLIALQNERDTELRKIDDQVAELLAEDLKQRNEFAAITASGCSDEAWDAEQKRRTGLQAMLASAEERREIVRRGYRRTIVERALEASVELRTKTAALQTITAAVPAAVGQTTASSQSLTKKYWLAGHGAVRMMWGCQRGER